MIQWLLTELEDTLYATSSVFAQQISLHGKIILSSFHIYALTIHHQVSVCVSGGVFFGLVQALLNCSNLLDMSL